MKPLSISATAVSPAVKFDPKNRIFEMSGYSRPENVRDFYFPLVQWIEDYKNELVRSNTTISTKDPISFKFKFVYFNSSSAKFIYDIVILLNEFSRVNLPVKIYWYYDEDDDELREAGEELSEMANVPFLYIETKKTE